MGEAAVAPIDPAALTAATLIATPVAKGTGAANASAALERLTAPVQRALVGEPAVETTLANASDHPDDPQRLRALAELLDALAARDTSFGEKLSGLISQAQGDSTIGEFVTQVHGHAQVGKLVTIGHAGEIHVHLPPKVPSRRLID